MFSFNTKDGGASYDSQQVQLAARVFFHWLYDIIIHKTSAQNPVRFAVHISCGG